MFVKLIYNYVANEELTIEEAHSVFREVFNKVLLNMALNYLLRVFNNANSIPHSPQEMQIFASKKVSKTY